MSGDHLVSNGVVNFYGLLQDPLNLRERLLRQPTASQYTNNGQHAATSFPITQRTLYSGPSLGGGGGGTTTAGGGGTAGPPPPAPIALQPVSETNVNFGISITDIILASIITSLGFVLASFIRDAIQGTVSSVLPPKKHSWVTGWIIAVIVTIILALVIFIILEIFSYNNQQVLDQIGTITEAQDESALGSAPPPSSSRPLPLPPSLSLPPSSAVPSSSSTFHFHPV
jgi:hypothetical protein